MKPRTRELAIPLQVKRAVAERDNCDGWPCCILCGTPAPTASPLSFSCAHYISRAHGGLGVERNILTLCPTCHRLYDSTEHETYYPILRRYLREHYENWTESELIYQK